MYFLGRQNIGFRGHRDQGNLTDKHNLNEIKILSSVVNVCVTFVFI